MRAKLRIRPGLLKRLRDLSGISSDEAQARMLDVSRSTINRIEKGDQPSAHFIVSVCTTYNLGLGEAFEIITDDHEQQAQHEQTKKAA